MIKRNAHTFHIPVMGTAFTIDTPIRVAKYGVASVISIGDDELCEEMRKHYAPQNGETYEPIEKFADDYRSRRITEYLNLVDRIVNRDFEAIKKQPFGEDNELKKYFDLLPGHSRLKQKYEIMLTTEDDLKKVQLQQECLDEMEIGGIDVNIMTKLDRNNIDKDGTPLAEEYSDALSAFRGFAKSTLESGIVFSAGFNRRLFAYIEKFADFFPDASGKIKKKIILKVSDYRSSLTQGKFLAKKGVWISEHRIESGLNCGGHAFASEGYLLGPILEEFKQKKSELTDFLYGICSEVLEKKGITPFSEKPNLEVTVQGGIGTYNEDQFLLNYFDVEGTGWATPFLLVPEATVLDEPTRDNLLKAGKDDLYLSGISPLGVPFNTVRGTASEKQKLDRYDNGRPGSPCPKGFLVSNMEFSKKPVCTASIFYQKRKIEELKNKIEDKKDLDEAIKRAVDKACLCEDLAAPALIINALENKRPLVTAVCPGPNLAYFSKIMSFKEMVDHIYGRGNVLNDTYRSNMFISELKMYIDYLAKELKTAVEEQIFEKREKYFTSFQNNLREGIDYYKSLVPKVKEESDQYRSEMTNDLAKLKAEFETLVANYNLQPA